MLWKFLITIPLCIQRCNSTSLGSELGKSLGYVYIGLCAIFVLITGILVLCRPKNKGIAASLLHLIIFLQFARCTALINFGYSDFGLSFWKSFGVFQNPYNFFSCVSSEDPWTRIGLDSTYFLCNSFFQLLLLGLTVMIWLLIPVFKFGTRGQRWIDFFIFIAYCSTIDLSVSAFLQLNSVRTTQLDFTSVLGSISSALAIFYLSLLGGLLALQCFFIYNGKYDNALTCFLTEEFIIDNNYYHYVYYPMQIMTKLLYSFLLVYTQDNKYTVPIVISITNLILCNTYAVSYIISMKPYLYAHNTVLTLILIIIEVVYLFIPLLYTFAAGNEWVIDCALLTLFSFGIFIAVLRGYLDFRDKSTVIPISEEREESPNSKKPNVRKEDILDSSDDALFSNDNTRHIEPDEMRRELRKKYTDIRRKRGIEIEAEAESQLDLKSPESKHLNTPRVDNFFADLAKKWESDGSTKAGMKKLDFREIDKDVSGNNRLSHSKRDAELTESPMSYLRGVNYSGMRVASETSQLSSYKVERPYVKRLKDIENLDDDVESRNRGVVFPSSASRSQISPMSHVTSLSNINAFTVKKFEPKF